VHKRGLHPSHERGSVLIHLLSKLGVVSHDWRLREGQPYIGILRLCCGLWSKLPSAGWPVHEAVGVAHEAIVSGWLVGEQVGDFISIIHLHLLLVIPHDVVAKLIGQAPFSEMYFVQLPGELLDALRQKTVLELALLQIALHAVVTSLAEADLFLEEHCRELFVALDGKATVSFNSLQLRLCLPQLVINFGLCDVDVLLQQLFDNLARLY